MSQGIRQFLVAVWLTSIGVANSGAAPADIPATAFAALPGYAHAKLSPDGAHIAYLYPIDNRWNMVVHNFEKRQNMRVPPPGDLDYNWLRWVNDHIVVYSLGFTAKRDLTETRESRLVAFDLKTRETTPIIKPAVKTGKVGSRTARERYGNAQEQDNVIDWLPDEPYHILVALDEDHDGSHEVRRIDVRNGKYKVIQRWTEGIQHWVTDQQHTVRLGWGLDNIDNFTLVIKDSSGDWQHLTSTDWYQDGWFPVGFSADPNIAYVSGPGENGTQVFATLDVDSLELGEIVAENVRVDMNYFVNHPWTGKPYGISFTEHTGQMHFIDADFERLQRSVDKALPDSNNSIVSLTADERKVLIVAANDREDGMVLIWDRDAGSMDPFGWHYEDLDAELLSPVKPVSFASTDGATVPGYLTLPIGADGDTPLPAVVLPHGGPAARDSARFDWLVQFLASRGYAVLQPNFRGSTGFGYNWEYAGRGEWGGLMQDDVDAGARWLIDEGIADPNRIAIMGGSYGGYSAAMGLIKSSKLYQCGVGFNGVYNLPQLIIDDKKYIGGTIWTRHIGLGDENAKAVSPVHRAAEFSGPFLIFQAEDDARVQPYHARDLAKRLAKADKPHKLVMTPHGGHSLVDANARELLLTETEQFLAGCLAPD